jgi:hypothetical protein
MEKTCLLTTLLAVYGLSAASGASYILVQDGQPAATIVLASEPTRSAQFAAAELQYHVRLITGATLPLATADQPSSGLRVLVGESAATRALGLSADDLKPYEYLVDSRRGALVLLGRDKADTGKVDYGDHNTFPGFFDEHGSCAAVYDFLEKGCGVRWVLPSELGILYDARTTLEVPRLRIRRAPFMEMRNQTIGYPIPADLHGDTIKPEVPWEALAWPEQHKWWHRQRLGGRWWQASHSLEGYYDRFLAQHPEWFAQGQTGRPTQMCYTNPELIRQVVQDARDFFDGRPKPPGTFADGDVFAVVPMDSGAPCKCANCQARVKAKPDRGAGQFSNDSWSELVFFFVDAVAREVAKTHPGKWIGTLGYSAYAYPPQSLKLAPNVCVQLCFHARFPHAPSPMANDWRILDAWLAESRGRPKLLWMYYCFPALTATQQQFRCFPAFCSETIIGNLRRYAKAGIRGVYFEPSYMHGSYRNPLMDQLESWLTFKLADDPELDGRELKDEFFTRYYGSAAGPMRQAYELIEHTFSDPDNYPEQMRGHQTEECAWGYLGTADRMRELARLMGQARQTARTDLERRRVALFDEGIVQYMAKGRETHVSKAGLRHSTLRTATCPRVPAAGGDPSRVAWEKAAALSGWRELQGAETQRSLVGRLAHDGQFLYLLLEEKLDTAKLCYQGDHIWNEDDWEVFLGDSRSRPYHQMGVNARGVHADLVHEPGGMTDWKSGARVSANTSGGDRWTTCIALPLGKATPKGLQPGATIYLNILRATNMENALAWIPTFGGFHAPERFGEVRLEP